jgi:hypothetical protein
VKRDDAPRRRLLGEGGVRVPEEAQEVAPAAEQPEPPLAVNRRRGARFLPDLTGLPAETKRRLDAEGVRRRGG